MWKKISERILSVSFSNIIGALLILFALIPLLLIKEAMEYLYEDSLVEDVCASTHSVVEMNNRMLDILMENIEEDSGQMLYNDSYYEIFSKIGSYSVADYMRADRLLTSELARQFSSQDEVFEYYLYYDGWLFGPSNEDIQSTAAAVERAGWNEAAHKAGGYPLWLAGYDYGESIQSEFLKNKGDYDFRYLFTMLREMHFQYSYEGSYYVLPKTVEPPVLVVHVKESSIRDLYRDSISFAGSLYGIANADGVVISSDNDTFPISTELDPEIFRYYGDSGFVSRKFQGEEYLLCYDTLESQGFFSFALVPMHVLVDDAVAQTRRLLQVFIVVLIALAVIIAVILPRNIFRPIRMLVQASERVATGDFSANTPVPRQKQFKTLTESFNRMEREISKLIHENYEVTLREKETQLSALSMQINPHFLYNTLNTINLLALKNEDEETSEMIVSLSEMLQYTVKNRGEKGTLEDELGWISNYLYIMEQRYHDIFQTEFDIDEGLMDCLIPKMILQPLLENSVLHGFCAGQSDGILKICVYREADEVCMEIEDNGCGMSREKLDRVLHADCREGHIGIASVRERLRLLYGDACRFSVDSQQSIGTKVQIIIPYEINKRKSS